MLDQTTKNKVRSIAVEHSLPFGQALKLYRHEENPSRYAFVKRVAKIDGAGVGDTAEGLSRLGRWLRRLRIKGTPEQEIADLEARVWEMRETMPCSLKEAVSLMFADPGAEFNLKNEPSKTRRCKHPRCAKVVDPSSYYWCWRHLPAQEPDPGEFIYASLSDDPSAEVSKISTSD